VELDATDALVCALCDPSVVRPWREEVWTPRGAIRAIRGCSRRSRIRANPR
jgi:hypothetical protein